MTGISTQQTMGRDQSSPSQPDQDGVIVLLTVVNVPLMLLVRALIVAIKVTTIRPISTAYSTAVGPSSTDEKSSD